MPIGRVHPSNERHRAQRAVRPTIGYLTPRIGDNVSQALWLGVIDAARQGGAALICFAGDCLARGAPGGGMILSFGGGMSPGTPAANIDTLLQTARDWPTR